jgi:hypothetical protein
MGLIDAPQLEHAVSTAPLGRPQNVKPALPSKALSKFGRVRILDTQMHKLRPRVRWQVPTDPLQSAARGWIDSELVPPK